MLDSFEIVTTSGVVLWSKTYAPVGAHIINGLIQDAFIEDKLRFAQQAGTVPSYKKEKYTLKWRRAKDLGLIFVAVYQSMLHLTWVEKLLDNIYTLFISLYKEQLKAPHAEVAHYPFDKYFEQQIRELESASGKAVNVVEHDGGRSVADKKVSDSAVDADNG
ncbi:hypothetical protein KEM55_000534, partial [Ascosphaera atra]